MRIIGGIYKGRKIIPSADFKARPTTDFAREGLFNVLSNKYDFENTDVLDLFGGTGSISYEFASRGAASVHLIEMDKRHIAGIRRIIRELQIETIRPVHIDVKAYLRTCTAKYDIVFADPPYDLPWLESLPELVIGSGVLKEGALFILEHPRRMNFTSNQYLLEHRHYGGVNFSFFRQTPRETENK